MFQKFLDFFILDIELLHFYGVAGSRSNSEMLFPLMILVTGAQPFNVNCSFVQYMKGMNRFNNFDRDSYAQNSFLESRVNQKCC